jgi:hypothetical protein
MATAAFADGVSRFGFKCFTFPAKLCPSVQTLSNAVKASGETCRLYASGSGIYHQKVGGSNLCFLAFDVDLSSTLLSIYISCEVTVPVLQHILGPYSTAIEHW